MTVGCTKISYLEAESLMDEVGQLVMVSPKSEESWSPVSPLALANVFVRGMDDNIYRCYYSPWPGCLKRTDMVCVDLGPPDRSDYHHISLEYLILHMGFYPTSTPNPKAVILTDLMLNGTGWNYEQLVECVNRSAHPESVLTNPVDAHRVWSSIFNDTKVRTRKNVRLSAHAE